MDHPQKYPSTPHWPWSLSIHRGDSFHKCPEEFLGQEVVITEKLDGGNTCLFQGNVFARSVQKPSNAGWMAMVKKHHAWKSLDRPQMFYGEDLSAKHSLSYSIPENETYRLFAIHEDNKWFSWDDVESLANLYNFLTVPILYRGTFSSVDQITEFFHTNINVPSALGPEREGFVMRFTNEFNNIEFASKVCKFVRKNHVQTDEHWTKNWKWNKLLPFNN